jgi:hypothetical protein
MPNRIILKRSSVSAKVPLASDLSAGELAINLADKRLFSKDGAGNVINVTVDAGHITSGSLTDPSWLTSLAKAKVGLGSVENTALSTWAGSGNITSLGTISSGTVPVARVSGLAASATIDTTNAANISSGTLPSGRLAGTYAISVTGTSGNGFSTKPNWAGNTNLIEGLSNFNTSRPSGFYEGSSATNAPTGGTWYNLINVRHSNAGNDHGFQLAMSYYANTLYHRHYQGGTGNSDGSFSAWATVLSSANYTAYAPSLTGSGASGSWGISITGNAATVTDGVYASTAQTITGAKTFSNAAYFTNGWVEFQMPGLTDGIIFKNGTTTIGSITRPNSRVNFNAGSGAANGFTFNTSTTSNAVLIAADGAVTTAGGISDLYGSLRALPQNAQGGAYTLAASDTGRHISASSTITVPSGTFSAGQLVTIYNNTAGSIAINVSGVTMYQAGTANSGNRTLAQRGIATVLCVGSNVFVVSGTGIT